MTATFGAFSPVLAREYLATEPEPVRWLWEDFIAEGSLTLLSAYAKVGKSTVLAPLILSVVKGQPFLGREAGKAPVLYLAVEEHPRDVRLRLEKFGLTPEDPLHIHSGRLLPEEFPRVAEYVRQEGNKLVVLDTLAGYWDLDDENDNAKVLRAGSPWLDLARTAAAVLLVHHDRKSGGEDGKGVRGGSALFGLVDQLITLERRQGGSATQRVIKALGRYGPAELVADYVEGRYVPVGGVPERLLNALTTGGGMETLVAASGLSDSTIMRHIEALGDRVARQGTGKRGDPFVYQLAA